MKNQNVCVCSCLPSQKGSGRWHLTLEPYPGPVLLLPDERPPTQSSTVYSYARRCSNPHFPFGHKSPGDEGQVQLMPPPCQESRENVEPPAARLWNFATRGWRRDDLHWQAAVETHLFACPSIVCNLLGLFTSAASLGGGTFEQQENLCHWSSNSAGSMSM